MAEIGLQDLIYQVKRELLATNQAQRAKDPDPLFFIDKVELEIAVKVQDGGSAGIKLSVLSFAELNAEASVTSSLSERAWSPTSIVVIATGKAAYTAILSVSRACCAVSARPVASICGVPQHRGVVGHPFGRPWARLGPGQRV